MTRKFQDAEVWQLYEWWRDGELSSEDAARCLRVDVAEAEALFAVIHAAVDKSTVDGAAGAVYYERAGRVLATPEAGSNHHRPRGGRDG